MIKVKTDIDVTGHHFNHWPLLRISHNGVVLFDGEIENQRTINLNLECGKHNILTFEHYGKQFGENSVWDSAEDGSKSCYVEINDIRFDDVSIENYKNKLTFCTKWSDTQLQLNTKEFIDQYDKFAFSGPMSFNGIVNLEFETPVFNWLTISKYKVPMAEIAYFSNYSARWHYDEDLKIIKEIEELINEKNSSN